MPAQVLRKLVDRCLEWQHSMSSYSRGAHSPFNSTLFSKIMNTKKIFLYGASVLLLLGVTFVNAEEIPQPLSELKPLITFASPDPTRTLLDINGVHLHQDGITRVVLGNRDTHPGSPQSWR